MFEVNIGIMFEGLRSVETNYNGFSFLGVHVQESSTSLMTTEWNVYFVGYLESCSWLMFVAFFIICVLSICIDVIRNCLYHTYDTLRVNRIMRIHRRQQKDALEVYKQNVTDTHEEASLMKRQMGQIQDDQAKHLQLQIKEFERNKNNIERSLASGALEKLRLVVLLNE